MTLSSSAPLADTPDSKDPASLRHATSLGAGSAVLAATQAACAAIVLVNGVGVLLGAGSLISVGISTFLHSPYITVPLMTLAGLIALVNLFVLWNQWRLRRHPAARWRMRPLSPAERRRIVTVLALSLGTALIIAAEVYTHGLLHPG